MDEPNAHALSFRNNGDICDCCSMFKDGERAQPVEKAPAREYDGGENARNEAISYRSRAEVDPCVAGIVCYRGNNSDSTVMPTLFST